MVRKVSGEPPRTFSQIVEIVHKSKRLQFATELVQLGLIILGLFILIGLVGLVQKLAGGHPW